MKIDLKKALTFPFSDSKWIVKLLIGGLLTLVPVVNFLAIGYIMRILKAVSEGQEPSLPEWGDWENLFKEGAFGFLILLIYYVVVTVATTILSAIPIIGCLMLPVNVILFAVLLPWTHISLIKYMQSNNFNDAFDFKGTLELIKADLSDYSICTLVTFFVIAVCMMLCCIPVFYGQLAAAVVFGTLYSLRSQTGASPAQS